MAETTLVTNSPITLRTLATRLQQGLDDGTMFNGAGRQRSFKATFKVTGTVQDEHLQRVRRKLLTKLSLNGRVLLQPSEADDGVTPLEVRITDSVS